MFGVTDEVLNKLFDKDMRWILIWEKLKMRAFISASDAEYFDETIKKLIKGE